MNDHTFNKLKNNPHYKFDESKYRPVQFGDLDKNTQELEIHPTGQNKTSVKKYEKNKKSNKRKNS